jgi:hypothetical protein
MIKTGILLASMAGLSAWAGVHANLDAPFKPQQDIRLTADAWACQTRSSLDGALVAEHNGQQQTRQQYFSNNQCQALPAGQHYRVVDVTRHDVGFASIDSDNAPTLWADARFVRQQ